MDDTNRNWMTEQEVDAFVGKGADYYKAKWKEHPETTWYKGWNAFALLFFVEWASYRRMYREVLLLFSGLVAVTFLFALLPGDLGFLAELTGQSVSLLLGAFGNGIYRNKALRTVRKTARMDDADRLDYLTRKGGTSAIGLIVCLLAEVAVVALPTFLFRLL